MGMSVGISGRGGRGHRRRGRHHALMSEINVTPMVDVMLVLLIIFMRKAAIGRLFQFRSRKQNPETKFGRSLASC